jgi:hypothetical protein
MILVMGTWNMRIIRSTLVPLHSYIIQALRLKLQFMVTEQVPTPQISSHIPYCSLSPEKKVSVKERLASKCFKNKEGIRNGMRANGQWTIREIPRMEMRMRITDQT